MLHQVGESTERDPACNEVPALVQLPYSVVLHRITVTHCEHKQLVSYTQALQLQYSKNAWTLLVGVWNGTQAQPVKNPLHK